MHVAGRQVAPEAIEVPAESIYLESPVFARRLASLMVYRRKEMRRSLRAMSRRSDGRFTWRELQRFENMELEFDAVLSSALAALYGIDLDSLLPLRGVAEAGSWFEAGPVDVDAAGDAFGLLTTYLRLIRRLRGQLSDEFVALRRTDIDRLSALVGKPGVAIVVRLGALMGATSVEQREMADTFLLGASVVTTAER